MCGIREHTHTHIHTYTHIQASAHRWFVCGLREVRKVLRLGKARVVIAAPNIEGVSADGGLDEFLGDILTM